MMIYYQYIYILQINSVQILHKIQMVFFDQINSIYITNYCLIRHKNSTYDNSVLKIII